MVWNDAVIEDPIMKHKQKRTVMRYLLSLIGNADFFENFILNMVPQNSKLMF